MDLEDTAPEAGGLYKSEISMGGETRKILMTGLGI